MPAPCERGVTVLGECIEDGNVLAVGVTMPPCGTVGDGGSYNDAAFLSGNRTPGYEFEKMDSEGFRSSSKPEFCRSKDGRSGREGSLGFGNSPCVFSLSRS